jgi:hypothetical protein
MSDLKRNRPRASWKIAALGTALGVGITGALLLTSALAVHNSPFPFELDGNVTDPAGGNDDWQGVFELSGITPPATGTPVATGAEVFLHDVPAAGGKETQYDAGKDSLNLNGWTRKDVTKVTPDKDNIQDAFAKQYMVDHDSNAATPAHRVIYFGADRLANNGDAALGFWFFQQRVQLTGTNGFSPNHTAYNASTGQRGDILVQVDFVSGGSSSEIQIFEWYGTGGDFGGGTLKEIAFGSANGNTVCLAGDAACATTNEVITGSYWPYTPKFGTAGRFPAESFFEGGIDLTALVGDICFNSFLANTRTSHSETADLKDLALGDFNTCGSIDLVRKVCQADGTLSPLFDYQTELYQTKHQLTINNDGQGSDVFDVSIRDDSVDSNTMCNIIGISGGIGAVSVPAGGIPIPDNTTFVKVADRLAAGVANQMSVTLLCQSPLNSFHNSASIRAGQTPGGTSLTDSYAESDADTKPHCTVTFNPTVTVTKSCNDVVLDKDNGFKPKVCSTITIKNNDATEHVDVTEFIDTHMDATTQDLLSFIPLGTGAHATHHVLQPAGQIGDTVTVTAPDTCYYPSKPDSDQTDPDLVQYSDQASAKATGQAGDEAPAAASDSANCALCPIGLDG